MDQGVIRPCNECTLAYAGEHYCTQGMTQSFLGCMAQAGMQPCQLERTFPGYAPSQATHLPSLRSFPVYAPSQATHLAMLEAYGMQLRPPLAPFSLAAGACRNSDYRRAC